jgi:hypothetical protein
MEIPSPTLNTLDCPRFATLQVDKSLTLPAFSWTAPPATARPVGLAVGRRLSCLIVFS